MRTSHKRVGISCRAVQLLANELDKKCCEHCHTPKRKIGDHHSMDWHPTPGDPKEFDPGQAYVCCTFARVCKRAKMHGWGNAKQQEQPKQDHPKPRSYLAHHPYEVGCHLENVISVTLASSVTSWSGSALENVGQKHLAAFDVTAKWLTGKHEQPTTTFFCVNPQCTDCGCNIERYWSYKLQCWVPLLHYAWLDNGIGELSMHHGLFGNHICSPVKTIHNNETYIPEYKAYKCTTMENHPIFGTAYSQDPIGVAVIKFTVQDEPDGFRYVLHGGSKVPENLTYLVWAAYDKPFVQTAEVYTVTSSGTKGSVAITEDLF